MELSRKCLAIEASVTLAIDAKAKKMKAAGEDVIGFGAGEPDFDTPEHIKLAAKQALDAGMTKYTPASGTVELKKAICDKLAADNNLDYKPNQIVISNGAKHSLFNAFAAVLNPGDEVILSAPYWVTYPELIRYCDGVPIFVQASEENGFVPTVEAFAAAITPKTKAILINSPGNPCGAVLSLDQMKAIAELAKKADCFIIADEIYERLIYDGQKHYSIAGVSEDAYKRTILVNGMSKAYAMTGWRIGYTASCPEVAEVMGNLQSHATSNPNSMAQHASVAALRGSDETVKAMAAEFDKRRLHMHAMINGIDGLSCQLPLGAFYIMLNIKQCIGKTCDGKVIGGSMDFADLLLEKEKVAVVPGLAFGADGYCRLSYATSMKNIDKGLKRIAEFVAKLK